MSPQQKIHWEKLQLLGMLGHMRASANYIHQQSGVAAPAILHRSLHVVEKHIKDLYATRMKLRKIFDAEMKKKKTKCT